MVEKKPGVYSFEYVIIAISLIISSVAVVSIFVVRRGGEETSPQEEETQPGERRSWVEGWLQYTGEWSMPEVELLPPPVEETEVTLEASPRVGEKVPEESPLPVGDGGLWDMSALHAIEERFTGKILKRGEWIYHVDPFGCLRVYNLSDLTLAFQEELPGRPTAFTNVSGLGLLLLSDPPRSALSQILAGGSHPSPQGTLLLVDLDDGGRRIYGRRLPGYPLDFHLEGSYLYVFTASLEREGRGLALSASVVGCDLSAPGLINVTELLKGVDLPWWWMDGWALLTEGDHQLLVQLAPPNLTVLGRLTLTDLSAPLAVDIYGGYLRVAQPYVSTLSFYRIPEEAGSGEEMVPVSMIFQVPGIGFSIEHAFLLGRYAIITTYTDLGITPKVFDASSPGNFSYIGDLPLQGGEIIFEVGEYLLVATLGRAPSLSLVRWNSPSTFEILSRMPASTYPPAVEIMYTRGVFVEGEEAIFDVLGTTSTGESVISLSHLHINYTSGEVLQGRIYSLPLDEAYSTLEITAGEGSYLILEGGFFGDVAGPRLAVADLKKEGPLQVLYPDFIPLGVMDLFSGVFVAGYYQETGRVVLRYYPAEWDGTTPPEEELTLIEGVGRGILRVRFVKGVGYLDVFVESKEDSGGVWEWGGNVSFFRIAPCCTGLDVVISAPRALHISQDTYLLDVIRRSEKSYVILTTTSSFILGLYTLELTEGGGFKWLCNISLNGLFYYDSVVTLFGDNLYLFLPSYDYLTTYFAAVNLSSLQYSEGNLSAIPFGRVGEEFVMIGWDASGYYLEGARVENTTEFNISWSYILPRCPLTAAFSEGEMVLILGGHPLISPYGRTMYFFTGEEANQTCLWLNITGGGVQVREAFRTVGVEEAVITSIGPIMRYFLPFYHPSSGTLYKGVEWPLIEVLRTARGLLLFTQFWIFISDPSEVREVVL
ncbi:MAG: hypothetical protein DRN55_03470 [Thermoplasmata archaeon]|nr:MAG: hypothetical protein DRN55_03470 [Thermoplasmata archaeon]